VTGVPGAGKTLVGLNVATAHFDKESELYSVFLSGNGPLVKMLQEALARDRVLRANEKGEKLKKGDHTPDSREIIDIKPISKEEYEQYWDSVARIVARNIFESMQKKPL